MINIYKTLCIQVSRTFNETSLTRTLDLAQHLSAKKANIEQFIGRLAKTYTPIVVGIAVLVCLLLYFFVEHYTFKTSLYRAMVFTYLLPLCIGYLLSHCVISDE